MPAKPANVQEYLASLPDDVRAVVEELRRRVLVVVPDAGERISYGIAGMTHGDKVFLHLAGWKKHVSVYPVPDTSDDPALAEALAPYAGERGTLKFPLAQPVPYDLVGQVAAKLVVQRGG